MDESYKKATKRRRRQRLIPLSPLPGAYPTIPSRSPSSPDLLPQVYSRTSSSVGRDTMKMLLQYFENKSNIQWNSDGNLISPFTGFNIIDILQDLTLSKVDRVKDKAPYYRLLLDMAGVPKGVIKSAKLRNALYGNPSIGGKIIHEWKSY